MKLTFSNAKQLKQIWKPNFFGLQGFFLPYDQKFYLGQELEISFVVNEQDWGIAQIKVVWQNIYGQDNEITPKGTFLKIKTVDDKLKTQLNSIKD